jgi:ABC-type multidrug transport system permease subunit
MRIARVMSVAVCGLIFGAVSARANVVFTPNDTFGCGACNVLFVGQNQTSTTVVGHNNDGAVVTYTSTTTLFAKGGQAEIDAATPNKVFNDLSWSSAPPYSLETFSVNTNLASQATGVINLDVTTNLGGVIPTYHWTVDGSGENKIVLATNTVGEFIVNIVMTTFTGFTNGLGITSFRQDRLEGIQAVPVPPALILFGTALAGMTVLGRRRKRRGSEMAV